MKQALYTNGALLTPKKIKELLEIEPCFVRISLNCVTSEIHARFHGYDLKQNYYERVLKNIELVAKEKIKRNSTTEFGASVIFNKVNVMDLVKVAQCLKDIIRRVGSGIDYVLYRPVFDYFGNSQVEKNVLNEAKSLLESEVPRALKDTGIELRILWRKFEDLKATCRCYQKCLANGWFGEIGPDGRMYLCCERHGDPNYEIGDLTEQTLEEIWKSERRLSVIECINKSKCKHCPPTRKPHKLNKIFAQIEKMRANGKLYTVRKWIDDLLQMQEHRRVRECDIFA